MIFDGILKIIVNENGLLFSFIVNGTGLYPPSTVFMVKAMGLPIIQSDLGLEMGGMDRI